MTQTQDPQAPPAKAKKPLLKRKRVWLLAIIVLIVIIAIANSGGTDEPSGTVSGAGTATPGDAPAATSAAQPTQQTQQAAPAGPSFPGQQKGDTTALPGQTITLDDIAVTTTELTDGDATFGATLCTTVTVANGGDDAQSFTPFDYKLQDPAGASRDNTFGGSDTQLNSGDLAPGGTVSGDVCFDNPSGGPGTYALIYKPSFAFSNDRGVWVNQR